MKILFPIHLYLPQHGAGGEAYVHNLAKHLISKGHQVRVLLKQADTYGITKMYNYEGVEVHPPIADEEWHFMWADVVISHLGFSDWSMQMARLFKKPFFFLAHNDCWQEYADIYVPPYGWRTNIIFNSHWIARKTRTSQPNIVLHPMTDPYKWNKQSDQRNYITLVNCNKNKGGHIFGKIAEKLPKKKFMAVEGGYDKQYIPILDNVTIQKNTPVIQGIYDNTRVLLIPSEYESWGMVAAEAMACGIPVICTKTPGLMENCGDAAIYVDKRNNIAEWVKAIKSLDKPETYEKYSNLVLARALENEPSKELDAFEKFLYAAAEQAFYPVK